MEEDIKKVVAPEEEVETLNEVPVEETISSATSEEEAVAVETLNEVTVPVEETISSATSERAKEYMGKQVLSEKMVTVNEKEYHSLNLVDGSTVQLPESEYMEAVK